MFGPSWLRRTPSCRLACQKLAVASAWETAMPSILADGNVEGHLKALVRVLEQHRFGRRSGRRLTSGL